MLIEPDFLPITIAEPPEVRAFWDGWLAWSRECGIDYDIGRTLAPRLGALGLEQIGDAAETAIYNGSSPWADYWTQTIVELRNDLVGSGRLNEALIDTFLGYCADPSWWTHTLSHSAPFRLVRLATDRRICLLGAFTFTSIRDQSYRRDACTTLSIL